ncbi:hypothetical protein [Chitinophaga arvensicola]|uniref:Uncharacterized protein n=1 Tax=Chitinophaga arvensicola TaxID=29529 RepID=A0A1I0S7R9_9BACT|nr:hypothetical protein [Chitinophaga arvensicola]SEW51863.1 hypothetical protein SAMN04488122_4548 [Chitinophaga arvensicola]
MLQIFLHKKAIAVSGEGLDLYKDYLRGLVEAQPCPPLYELVTMLLHQQDYWAVNFEPEYDGVEVIQAGTIGDVIDGIDYSFKVVERGFFLWKEINNNSF